MTQNPEKHWFGEDKVDPTEKTRRVLGVFDSVAPKYDLMNDVMSGGLHRPWKNAFVRRIRPRKGLSYLDVAGGTGDIAFRIRRRTGADTPITLCDINAEMLGVGRDRALDRGYHDLNWVTGNAESLPLPDHSQDVYTIAFGLRNVTHIDTALSEAFRVLKPGGRFYCLEFSHIEDPALAKLYDLYSYNMIPKMGKIIAKDESSYQYLVESIRKFPKQSTLCNRLKQAGFAHTTYGNLTFGVVAIHSAIKA